VLGLGTLVMDTLEKFIHCCPSAIPTLLNSPRVLTADRTPSKKQEQDWKPTNQTAHILSMNLRKMDSEDLIKLGDNGLDSLKIFGKPMDEKEGLCSLEGCPRIAHHESLRHYHRAPQTPR